MNVADIAPVRALTGLKYLRCVGEYPVKGKLVDLSPPLDGMTLSWLECTETQIADLSPLAGMPLTHLRIASTSVSDLSPLVGMPLTLLHCGGNGSKISDWSPLKKLNLARLSLYATPKFSDLSVLAGMPLKDLDIGGTPVADLFPLKGKKLTKLEIHNTPVTDTFAATRGASDDL